MLPTRGPGLQCGRTMAYRLIKLFPTCTFMSQARFPAGIRNAGKSGSCLLLKPTKLRHDFVRSSKCDLRDAGAEAMKSYRPRLV